MCGFISIFSKGKDRVFTREMMEEALNKIKHRGPDDEGIYEDNNALLGFRRLSIIDLDKGHQPLEKDKYLIVFNGEIYNYKNIRAKLIEKGYNFETDSDTEVLLTNYIEKGPECIKEFRGMFAFIIYNKETNEFFGGRDYFGIKPLYYINNENYIIFSSEYKGMLSLVHKLEIDIKSLQEYFSFQYVPGNNTMIKAIKKVPIASYFYRDKGEIIFNQYSNVNYRCDYSIDEGNIREVMRDSVKAHMIADVEIGTFLSGGVDSSIIATLASIENPKIKSFTLGFNVHGYDEIDIAKKTSEELNIENIKIQISENEYIEAIDKVVYSFDDPVADPSAFGMYFLSKEASKHVKVVMSGEGADELFAGYNIYKEYYPLRFINKLPKFFKKIINYIAKKLPNIPGKSFLLRGTTPLKNRYIGNAKIFDNKECRELLVNFNSSSTYENSLRNIYKECEEKGYDYVTTMQKVDMETWLPGDILMKSDKMSMANSLELRVPFLDIEVLKIAEALPLEKKVTSKGTKVALRNAFKGLVPKHVVDRRKLGFPTPIRLWLKGELGNRVREVINESNVHDYINKEYSLKLLDDHIKGVADNSRKIWSVFIFCVWYKKFIEESLG